MSSADSGEPSPASPPSAGLPSSILFLARFLVMRSPSPNESLSPYQSTGIRYDEMGMFSWSERAARLIVCSESGR